MADPPIGVRLKLARANQHLETLHAEIEAFMQGDPDSVSNSGGVNIHFDGPKGEWVGTARIPVQPPPDWGALAGDVLFNLRSALDQLAWQLVRANGGTPTTRTEFPVFVDESEFDSRAVPKIAGMAPDAQAIVRELQPFHAGEDADVTLLWLLHALNIFDKHRILPVASVFLVEARATIDFPRSIPIRKRYNRPAGPIEDGAVIFDYRWDASALPLNAEMDMQLGFSFDVSFGEGGDLPIEENPAGGLPVSILLRGILEHIRDEVIPRFLPFLPGHLTGPLDTR